MKNVHHLGPVRDAADCGAENTVEQSAPNTGAREGSANPYATKTTVVRSSPLCDTELLAYRIDQTQSSFVPQRKRAIVMQKPSRTWIRVPADADLESRFSIIDHQRCLYVVRPDLQTALRHVAKKCLLIPYVTSGGEPGVWPLTTWGMWHDSGVEAACVAKTQWVLLHADDNAYGYELAPALQGLAPAFPGSASEMVLEAIRERRIDSLEHEVALIKLGKSV